MDDLFPDDRRHLTLDPGATLLGGFALPTGQALLDAIETIAVAAPFRHWETPGGRRMSVAMTNAGGLGWMSDRRGDRLIVGHLQGDGAQGFCEQIRGSKISPFPIRPGYSQRG